VEKNFFVHQSSYVSDKALVGEGTKIWHFSHIRESAVIGRNVTIGQNVYIDEFVTIGDNCKIQNNVSIYNGVIIGNNVYIGPSVVFGNDLYPISSIWSKDMIISTNIKDDVSIGANSTIIPGVTIGQFSLIGAGSVVTKNIPEHCLAYGAPAKIKDNSYRL